ncbi:MAG TPA: cyclodeaminase/cyclohydrolase family protein [Negativicutes bacterium]
MLVDKTVTDFVEDLASNSPMPGGGGVAALAGALGAALGLMVCSLTEGKEKFSHLQEAITEIKQKGIILKEELIRCVDGDGHSYLGIVKACKLPKTTEQEKQQRTACIQEATKEAARFSLHVAQSCLEVMEFAVQIVLVGNPSAASESAACGVIAYGGVHAAVVTVNINLISIKDQSFVEDMQAAVQAIKDQAERLNHQILMEAEKVIC